LIYPRATVELEMVPWAIDQRTPQHRAIQWVELVRANSGNGVRRALKVREQHGPRFELEELGLPGRDFFHPGQFDRRHSGRLVEIGG
jgi:hypothetical protein